MGVHRSSHAVWDCQYHLVWSTKYRRKVFTTTKIKKSCGKKLQEIAEQYDMNIMNLEKEERTFE